MEKSLQELKKQIILHQFNVSVPPYRLGYIPAGIIIALGVFLLIVAARL